MSQPGDKVEFEMLDYERIENEYVSFRLEDGTIVKVKVDLDRVGKAVTRRNPDGTPHYAINTAVKLSILPAEKRFTVAKDRLKNSPKSPPGQMFS